ncbi:MAG TPA: hypothetical protein VKQ28_16630 [Candidatus Acidoferrum sp.]|nr:hypothetical protein [Candidatus Acidoferrum sp.]
MNKRRWIPWLAAILLAVTLVGLDALVRSRDSDGGSRDALLSAMPANASAVLFIDLAALRRAPFAAEFYNWIPKNQVDADYAQFLRATGFDYERDLDRAAIANVKAGADSQLFAVAQGRFDRGRIEAYATQSGTREARGGREIFTVPLNEGARKISFTFLGKGKIALTDGGNLAPFLAQPQDGSDLRDWREHFRREAGSPVFAVIRQDAAAGSALESRTPGGFQSPQLSALLDQLQWITLAGKPQDRALRIVAEGECASEQTTRQLADLLNGVLVLAQAGLNGPKTRQQLAAGTRDAYLELLKGADISRLDRGETKSVRIVFDVTPKLLEAAASATPTPASVAPAVLPDKAPGRKRGAQKDAKQ